MKNNQKYNHNRRYKKMTKQFNEILTEYGTQTVYAGIVDQATQDELTDQFYYRYVTDNDKFIRFFTRNLRRVADRYNNLVRIETIKFDPMVTRYFEEQDKIDKEITHAKSDTEAGNNGQTTTNGGTITVKIDSQTDGTANSEGSAQNSYTNTNTNVVDSDNSTTTTDTVRTRDLVSNTPHSNVSSATTGGLMSPISWQYASGLTDHGEDNTHATTGEVDTTTTDNGSGSASDTTTSETTTQNIIDGTEVTTRADTVTISGNNSKTKETEESSTEKANNTKRYTGREGQSPQELLEKARSYIKGSSAFEWLVNELSICFMDNALYGEEW